MKCKEYPYPKNISLQRVRSYPVGLVLVLSVDWFMGMARALGNLIGNCAATVAVAAWEGDIDRQIAHAALNGSPVAAPPHGPEASRRPRLTSQ